MEPASRTLNGELLVEQPSNTALQRASNSSVQLTLIAIWRHTFKAGSVPVSTVASRLTPIC